MKIIPRLNLINNKKILVLTLLLMIVFLFAIIHPAHAARTKVSLPKSLAQGKVTASVKIKSHHKDTRKTIFYIDGIKFATDRKRPFKTIINTNKLTIGRHVLTSRTQFSTRKSGQIINKTETSKFLFTVERKFKSGPYSVINPTTTMLGDWSLDFSEEFSGNMLNSSRWCTSWFNGGVMNNVRTSSENVTVSRGKLILTLKEPNNGALINTNPTDCGIPGYQFGLGYYVEARIRFPGKEDNIFNWPAWWTNGQSWPDNGEIDIAEGILGSMTSNYHARNINSASGLIPGNWANKFHTFAVNREFGVNYIYYDKKLVATHPSVDSASLHYLILNIGGNEIFGPSSQVIVDWVRSWKRK